MIHKIKQKIKDWKEDRKINKKIRQDLKALKKRDQVEKDPMLERIKAMLFLFSQFSNKDFLIVTEKINESFSIPGNRFVLKSSKNWPKDDFFIEYWKGKLEYNNNCWKVVEDDT